MSDPKENNNTPNSMPVQNDDLTLAPDDTPLGMRERALLVESRSPAQKEYDAETDIEGMRDMRQVINDRIKNPTAYGAPPGSDDIGILLAPGQFPEFADYPRHFPTNEVINDLIIANNPHDRREFAYRQHVENAITAATESVNPPVANFKTATAWVRTRPDGTAPSPGPDFIRLGDVGGNTFFATKSMLAAARPAGINAAAQAIHRRLPAWHAAVKNAAAPALALHHLARHAATTHPSLAPVRQRQSAARVVRAAAAGGAGVAPGLAARIARQGMAAPGVQGGARKAGPGSLPAGAAAVPGAGVTPRRGGIAPPDLVGIARRAGAVHGAMAPALGTQGAANVARAVLGHRAGASSLAPKFHAARGLPSVAPRGQAGAGAGMAAPRHADLPPVAPVPAGVPRATAAGRLPMRTAGRDGTAGAEPPAAARDSAAARQRDVARALEGYFELQARLPPSSGAGFDPTLSPAWAGLQIPG